jgi:hypothetical protein
LAAWIASLLSCANADVEAYSAITFVTLSMERFRCGDVCSRDRAQLLN